MNIWCILIYLIGCSDIMYGASNMFLSQSFGKSLIIEMEGWCVGLFCLCLLAPLQSLYRRTPVEAQPFNAGEKSLLPLACDISLGQ